LEPAEKVQLLALYAMLAVDDTGRKVGVAALEASFGRAPKFISKSLIPPALAGDGFEVKERADKGKGRKLTADVNDMMAEQARAWDGDWSYVDMSEWLEEQGVSVTARAICAHCMGPVWNTHLTVRATPTLTKIVMEARVAFATAELEVDDEFTVHVDEKWFYTVRIHQNELKLPAGERPKKRTVHHKSHVPKRMYLCALGKPGPNFDGRVALEEITETRVADRLCKSKGRVKGDEYEKDVTMDCDKYFEMMTELIFPAIRKAYRGRTTTVRVQQDGARPHTGKDIVARLNEAGAQVKRGSNDPTIVVFTQSSNSPDLNICDLAFFRALGVAVRKARRGATDSFDLDKLTLDVLAEYENYPALELAKMWEYRKYVLRQIIACGGGNQYEQHRPLDTKKADEERAAKRLK
jgi:hypothetical protein